MADKFGVCAMCGRWDYLDTHHIFEGSLRKKSEKYKDYCTIRICRTCHNKIHSRPADYLWLKQKTQYIAMYYLGWTIEDWHREFGKSYIQEENK